MNIPGIAEQNQLVNLHLKIRDALQYNLTASSNISYPVQSNFLAHKKEY